MKKASLFAIILLYPLWLAYAQFNGFIFAPIEEENAGALIDRNGEPLNEDVRDDIVIRNPQVGACCIEFRVRRRYGRAALPLSGRHLV